MNWHLIPISEIAQLLNSTPSGIDHDTASQLLVQHGKNEIEDKKKENHSSNVFPSVF
jgi:Ca2+-transporting ATPase